MLAGRAAEEIIFNERTTGAGNDLERATEMARKMVTEWGMSEIVGPIRLAHKEGEVFLGKEMSSRQDYSEATSLEVDKEIKDLIVNAYNNAINLLKENEKSLHKLAKLLLEKEVVEAKDLDEVIKPSSPEDTPPDLTGFNPHTTTAFNKIS